MARNVLLLTATVAPPKNALDLARTDVELRRADYARALERHLDLLERGVFDGLVFTENSNSDLSLFEQMTANRGLAARAEFITYAGLGYPPEYGRAYGEARIIDHAMEHSRLLRELAEPGDLVWKITGRYWVHNFRELVESCPRPLDFYCNMRDFPLRWVDMYLLAWTRRGYDTFLRDVAEQLRMGPDTPSGVSPEELLRELLEERKARAVLVPRLARTPIIDGFRGYDNKSYAEANRWKNLARRVALRLAPKLWI